MKQSPPAHLGVLYLSCDYYPLRSFIAFQPPYRSIQLLFLTPHVSKISNPPVFLLRRDLARRRAAISIFFILRPTEALSFSHSLSLPFEFLVIGFREQKRPGSLCASLPVLRSLWPFLEKDRGTKRWRETRGTVVGKI